ncbi:MAG: lamin tail domain-containing protein [Deltaproteobacteria bacterium]|nr:lamin tail domain-containing protein [Deltaproteobacteria bacterium]
MPRPDSLLQPSGPRSAKPLLQGLRLAFFLLSLFPLFPFPHFAFSLFPFSPSPVFASTVAAVIDGDTVLLTDGTRVRYLGVNTPEHGQPFYEDAKRYNEQLVLHKEVRLERNKPERDAFGRVLAYVYAGDVLVNARLIAEGLGHLFVLGALDRYEEWLRLQTDAQKQHKGIWRLGGVPGPLFITTVHADAEGNDRRNPNGEYVRICNVSAGPVDLKGFAIQDAARHRYVFPEGILDPGYTVLLLSGKGQDTTSRGQLRFHWGDGPIWNNDKDTASLFDPSGKLIDSFQTHGDVRE